MSRPCDKDDSTQRLASGGSIHLREDEDDNGKASKCLRTDNVVPRDYIPPFFPEEVGRKYVVIRGIQPGIYCNRYVIEPSNQTHTDVASQKLI
jgi:hypothetical protein